MSLSGRELFPFPNEALTPAWVALTSDDFPMMFGVVLVGTYTSVFIASPILIYLGVGTGRDSLSAPDRDK